MNFYRGKAAEQSNSSNADWQMYYLAIAAAQDGTLPEYPDREAEIPLTDSNGERFCSKPDQVYWRARVACFFRRAAPQEIAERAARQGG